MTRKTVDLTPTWQGILPALLALSQSEFGKNRDIAASELRRMAELADAYVKLSKENR